MPGLRLGLGLGLAAAIAASPYAAEINQGAQLITDFAGSKNGQPYYWYKGTRYTSPANIPGWTFSRASAGYAETKDGRLVAFGPGEPRITDRGLLVEEARQNLLSVSEQFSDAGWNKSNSTVTQNSRMAPNGTMTASLVARAAGASGYVGRGVSVAQAVGTTVTGSIYVKREPTTTRVGLRLQGNYPDRYDAVFDLTTGVIAGQQASGNWSSGSATITPAGDYFRLTITATSATSALTSFNFGPTEALRPVSSWESALVVPADVTAWGAMVELGAFATSYIYTFGSAATRAADSAYITGLGEILGKFRTNKVTIANANPTTTAGISTTGSLAVSIVDDVAELAAAGLQGLATSGKVFKLDNSAGAAQTFAGFPGISGNTNTHTASAYLRGGVGVFCIGSVGCNAVPASAGYVRRSFTGPGFAGGGQLQVGVNAGQVMYVILPMLEESATVNEVIVTQNGAPASVGNPFTLIGAADLPVAADGVRRMIVSANDGTTTNRIMVHREANYGAQFSVIWPASSRTLGEPGKGGVRVLKIGGRVRLTELLAATDGNVYPPGSLSGLPSNLNRLDIGAMLNSSPLNGYVQRVLVLGDTSDAQLQGLTQ